MEELKNKINLDIDKERIREIVEESLRMIHEYIDLDNTIVDKDVLEQLERILENGQISTKFFLKAGCKRIPDLQLRIDPRRKKILGISGLRKRVIQLNYFLRIL